MIKEFLKHIILCVDVDRFNVPRVQPVRIHRKRKRNPGGEISLPITPTTKHVNEEIKRRVQNGTYKVGELIVPNEYTKIVLSQSGSLCQHIFVVEGPKMPLKMISKDLLSNQETGLFRDKSSEGIPTTTG